MEEKHKPYYHLFDNFTGTLEEQYVLCLKAVEIEENKARIGSRKDIMIKCSTCGEIIKLTGCSSHSKLCSNIHKDKIKQYKLHFEGFDNCIVCGKPLLSDSTKSRDTRLTTCSKKCTNRMYSFMDGYEKYKKKCKICDKEFIGKPLTCSRECGYKLASQSIEKWHGDNKNTLQYIDRCNKIKSAGNFEKMQEHNKINGIWNKGIYGADYLHHFDKPDGTNSCIEGMKKSKFIKKTKPEIKMDDLLKDLEFDYRYNIFHGSKQFDFSLRFEKWMIIIEVDGDYWHKSILSCKNEDERKMQRQIDTLKENHIIITNNKIKKMDRNWYIIRFWENDINKDIETIKIFLNNLKTSRDEHELQNIILKIKEYYAQKG